MMLEARVRTDEAIEATVCVDARALRRDWKSFSAFSCAVMSTSCHSLRWDMGRLFPFRQYFHTMNVAMAMKAIPPMTPPAMAPTFGLLAGASPAVGSGWQPTEAHWSHVREFWTQTSLALHLIPSQDSAAVSHATHRFSIRKTFSASLSARMDMATVDGVVRGSATPGEEATRASCQLWAHPVVCDADREGVVRRK